MLQGKQRRQISPKKEVSAKEAKARDSKAFAEKAKASPKAKVASFAEVICF